MIQNIEIQNYLAGTLWGHYIGQSSTAMGALCFEATCETFARSTGQRVPQRSRGVVIWE